MWAAATELWGSWAAVGRLGGSGVAVAAWNVRRFIAVLLPMWGSKCSLGETLRLFSPPLPPPSQFEDFQTEKAFEILRCQRDRLLCFNDDIQARRLTLVKRIKFASE